MMGVFRHAFQEDSAAAGKVEVTGTIVPTRSTKAVLFDDGASQQWLPKSKITISEIKGGMVEVLMPEWLAKEKKYI